MIRISTLLGLSFLTIALIVGAGQSGGEKQEQPKKKFTLPANFGKLKLSDEQKKKIYDVRGTYWTKISALKEQLEALEKQEFGDCLKILTDDQRALYRKIVTKEVPETKKSDKSD